MCFSGSAFQVLRFRMTSQMPAAMPAAHTATAKIRTGLVRVRVSAEAVVLAASLSTCAVEAGTDWDAADCGLAVVSGAGEPAGTESAAAEPAVLPATGAVLPGVGAGVWPGAADGVETGPVTAPGAEGASGVEGVPVGEGTSGVGAGSVTETVT